MRHESSDLHFDVNTDHLDSFLVRFKSISEGHDGNYQRDYPCSFLKDTSISCDKYRLFLNSSSLSESYSPKHINLYFLLFMIVHPS